MYTVCFKSYYNNWADPVETEEYETLPEARTRADEMYSLEVTEVSPNCPNCFVSNGTETWVEGPASHKIGIQTLNQPFRVYDEYLCLEDAQEAYRSLLHQWRRNGGRVAETTENERFAKIGHDGQLIEVVAIFAV